MGLLVLLFLLPIIVCIIYAYNGDNKTELDKDEYEQALYYDSLVNAARDGDEFAQAELQDEFGGEIF